MAVEIQNHFGEVLEKLMDPSNEIRSEAEKTYENIPVETKVPLLLNFIGDLVKKSEVRSLAGILLRRLFANEFDQTWPAVGPEGQRITKVQLLAAIQQESDVAVLKKICEATAELSRHLIDENANNQWPEILQFLFDCANSNSSSLKEAALHIFSTVPGVFGSQQIHYVDVIKQMLNRCMIDETSAQVRFAAVKALFSFVVSNEKDQHILATFRDLLPGAIQVVAESIQVHNDDNLLKCLIDVAENIPKFLRSQLEPIVTMALKVVVNEEMTDNLRQLALEVIVTLAESAPAMVRKFGKAIPDLVLCVLRLMCDLEDDDQWVYEDDIDEDDDSDTNAVAAESALDRLACSLGGKTMLPLIIGSLPQMLTNQDWKSRHAALMSISACGEGCHKEMEGMLSEVVDSVLPFLRDSHPRVRYAACNALGQMCTDFGPLLQKKFHAKILPGLLMVLQENGTQPRVQAHAGAALVNFSEDCPKTVLGPYLDGIISQLEHVLSTKFQELVEKGSKLVLEQIVTTLASVADAAEDRFIAYYDRFIPNLKYIIKNAVQPELKLLRGKTIECVSLIGLAVGKEKFMHDCGDVMQLLLESQVGQELADDDPQVSYLISAWARMCKILGKEFEQYLPMVMGPVLKAASMKPEVALLDTDEMQRLDDDPDWQFVTLGDSQNFGIRTAGLEEKATACQMLVCYARELIDGFAPYADEVVKIMVPLLKFYFHDDCRVAAAEILPFLIDCAKTRGPGFVVEMWQFMLPALIKAIESEPEKDIKAEMMYSLAQCIERLGRGCINEAAMQELVAILRSLMDEHFKRQMDRHEQRKDEDYDEVVEESLLNEDDEDVYLLTKVADIFHALFATHNEEALPAFDQLLDHFVKLLSPDRPWPDRQWGICIWDDVAEYVGRRSIDYQQHFLQPVLNGLSDKQPEVRQAAAYGVGMLAQHGCGLYGSVLAGVLPVLFQVVHAPDSRSPENISATENAIAAVTKICKYDQGHINVDDVIPHWLQWLPVWEDKEEAEHVYGYMCDLFESNNSALLGSNFSNIPRCIAIIADAFHLNVLDEAGNTSSRLRAIVRQLQAHAELFAACVAQLQDVQRTALQNALQVAA